MFSHRTSAIARASIVPLVLALSLGTTGILSAQAAAPIGLVKSFKVPTNNSEPFHITRGSDGNMWFTEGDQLSPSAATHNVGRITPAGSITEFPVCSDCFPADIVQGPSNILYFTTNDPGLGRITTSGQVLASVAPNNGLANGEGITAAGNNIWYTDNNNNALWRYDVVGGTFTEFPVTQSSVPFDVAVAADGMVWFTEPGAGAIGRLNPATGTFTETSIPSGSPRELAIAPDGTIWFTDRFQHMVGKLVPGPSSNVVTEFATLTPNAGPEDVAVTPSGVVWFSQEVAGNVARITTAGAITEGKSVKGSQPAGIAIGPDGQTPWYAMLAGEKIAFLSLK